ncbi:MAG TPA: hypothetical protein VKP78_06870 [bacterium]|nr:hypothetical protein [bacterium]
MKFKNIFLIIFLLLTQLSCSTRYIKNDSDDQLVVLLHGIKDKPYIMWKLEKGLQEQSYAVLNMHYPSVRADMDSIITALEKKIGPVSREFDRIHFVTHSLGGIVIRAYLDEHKQPNFGRLVMIAPPNRGAIMAERFEDVFLYKWMYGKTGQKLGKDSTDYWQQFPAPSIPFGIIAGGLKNKGGFNPLIPGDDDGTVGVEETRIQGYQDFIVIAGLHTSLLWQDNTLEQTLYFLKHGEFK